ncbi:GDSL lipase/acylhydrolase family protein [Talaromyces stipitatus ATCC 10500]|uniref:GDSL lipase/acylhydrolase family protein n=1 Tax=Talaromyces stipitatus (strain ATCC 10500 / CBS 375.48 / QM 6759 / NRRL 1006) TaxID=441959 RepID=B8LXX0_TALSN|nr:GDSL lipase/acylhydrolase family protein [Talaromyces stipitatus ATCC 10500]EED22785.1 GDSL lipase/acylhydrolase family protein [Talaromyces stipitatus ATCC 10500]
MKSVYVLMLLSQLTAAAFPNPGGNSSKWRLKKFKSLVTFGDSYTDESRYGYFASHNGSAPPVGWVDPISNNTSSGGYIWARYVAISANVNLYDYAVDGAVCSNEISPRYVPSINGNFPSVLEYEVPAYVADSKFVTNGSPFLDIPPWGTVYSMWIGTNDLGEDAFLTDSQVPGRSLPDYTECVFTALDKIYANGARYFVLQNVIPLQLVPLYATPKNGGVYATYGDTSGTPNVTETSYRMWESVKTVNEIYKYQLPFELLIRNRYPGAQFALMDMYSIISDIYYNPEQYLASPANVTGFIEHCDARGECSRLPNEESFLWYNYLHPSWKTDSIIAERFVEVVEGRSKYATYWG